MFKLRWDRYAILSHSLQHNPPQSNAILFIEQMYIRKMARRKQSYTVNGSYTVNDTIYQNIPPVLSEIEGCYQMGQKTVREKKKTNSLWDKNEF